MSEQLESRLYESSQGDLLKQVIDSMTNYVFFKGLDGKYLGCNKQYESLIGKSEAEIIGHTAYDFNKPAIADLFTSSDRAVIETGIPFKFEVWQKKADGTEILVENTKSPLFDDLGNIIGILGVFHDITKQREAENALRSSEEKYRMITENSSDVIWVMNLKTHHFDYLSPSVEQLWGYSEEEALKLTIEDVMTPASLEIVTKQIAQTLPDFFNNPDENRQHYNQIQQICKDGTIIWIEFLARYQVDQHGNIVAIGMSRNIDERKKTEQALQESEVKYRMIAENTSDAIWLYNLDRDRFTYFSPSIFQLRGLTVEEALREKFLNTVTPEFKNIVAKKIEDAKSFLISHPEADHREILEVQQSTRTGDDIWVEISARLRFNEQHELEILGVSRNIEERKRTENEVLYLGYHDQLTELYNRHYFELTITDEMERADRYGDPLSLLLLDLDHFKVVNDTWGHPVGDDLLRLTAKTIENMVRSTDIVVRYGGEEFIVLMPKTSREGAAEAAEKIRSAIEQEYHPVIGHRTVSIGVAGRMDNESFSHWYRRVDEALYLAKESGRNRVVTSDENKNQTMNSVRINWQPEWNSGNEIIDSQHRELIDIANGLVSMSLAGLGYEESEQQIDLLLDHIVLHFESEEAILAAAGFPSTLTHAKIHSRLVMKAKRLKESCKNGDAMISAFFLFMVEDVIIGHLLDADVKFFPYVRGNL